MTNEQSVGRAYGFFAILPSNHDTIVNSLLKAQERVPTPLGLELSLSTSKDMNTAPQEVKDFLSDSNMQFQYFISATLPGSSHEQCATLVDSLLNELRVEKKACRSLKIVLYNSGKGLTMKR